MVSTWWIVFFAQLNILNNSHSSLIGLGLGIVKVLDVYCTKQAFIRCFFSISKTKVNSSAFIYKVIL